MTMIGQPISIRVRYSVFNNSVVAYLAGAPCSCERERMAALPLAHARGYRNTATVMINPL
jgi:hypothetical protein